MNNSNNKIPIFDILLILSSIFIMFTLSLLFGSLILLVYAIFKLSINKHIIHIFKGAKAYNSRNYVDSLKYYRNASLYPKVRFSIINTYIFLELKYGTPITALEVIHNIKSIRQLNDNELYNLLVLESLVEWKRNNLEEAVYILQALHGKEYKSTTFYEIFGFVLMANGNIEKALELTLEGIDYDDSSSVIKANLGEIYYKTNNINKSMEIFNELIDDNVNFSEPYYYLGLIYKEKNNKEKAKQLLEKALNTKDSILSNLTKNDIENVLISLN